MFKKIFYGSIICLFCLGLFCCGGGSNNNDGTPTAPTGPLSDWEGDWDSHYTYMNEQDAKDGFETMAGSGGHTASDVESVVKTAYRTDFARLVIDNKTITYYEFDKTTERCKCEYADIGEGTMSGEAARKFELKAGESDACQNYEYVLLQPLAHHDSGEEHLHIRYGGTGFNDLMEGSDNTNWWPILTRLADTTTEYVVDYMLEFSNFYSGLLPDIGTLSFNANGEDFVRDGFVSEDGWRIDFSKVYLNMSTPTAYQIETDRSSDQARHAGHGDDGVSSANIPEGAVRAELTGSFFLDLKQDTFTVGSLQNAATGTYNYLDFLVSPATSGSQGFVNDHDGCSIVLTGIATKAGEADVNFTIKFNETMKFAACGPVEGAAALETSGTASVEMTFHFDHIFGDFDEGPADPTDEDTVNYLAIGFQPFADLADNGTLSISQANMISAGMEKDTYNKLMTAVKTLGHTGEAHCDCIEAASRRFMTNHGIFILQEGNSYDDPRNPKRVVLQTTSESNTHTIVSYYKDIEGEDPLAEGCKYQYVESRPDPHYFPQYKSSVWDLFKLADGQAEAYASYTYLAIRSPHGNPPHMHMRYGDAATSFDDLLSMSNDEENSATFDPWWSEYKSFSSDTPPAKGFNYLNVNGTLVIDPFSPDEVYNDPRNPSKMVMLTSEESNTETTLTFYKSDDENSVWASGSYQYVGTKPDPHYFPQYKHSVWDLFELQTGASGDHSAFKYVIYRSPHSNPVHVHMRYGSTSTGELLDMSNDDAVGFDPWWSVYCEGGLSFTCD